MSPEEKDMLIEMKDALTDTLEAVREAFANSGFYQLSDYKATNDGYENWLFRAREAIKKSDEFITLKT